MDVVFDTGSDWLSIHGTECEDCDGDKFDSYGSGTRVSVDEVERIYQGTLLKGNEFRDKVCLSAGQCVNNFRYFLIEKQQGT